MLDFLGLTRGQINKLLGATLALVALPRESRERCIDAFLSATMLEWASTMPREPEQSPPQPGPH